MRTRPFDMCGQLYPPFLAGITGVSFIGSLRPRGATSLQPIADGLIKRIKMPLPPVIFSTVVFGIATASDIAAIGRIGLKVPGVPEDAPDDDHLANATR